MSAPISARVLSDKSVRELVDYRAAAGHELVVHVYYIPGVRFIIAPISGSGIRVENREVSVLDETCEDEELGRRICDNLLWHQSKAPDDLRGMKSSDWPAYVVSGMRSVRQFESSSIYITIATRNSALEIHARPFYVFNSGDRYVGVGASIHRTHDEIGEAVRLAIRGVKTLQEADYF